VGGVPDHYILVVDRLAIEEAIEARFVRRALDPTAVSAGVVS